MPIVALLAPVGGGQWLDIVRAEAFKTIFTFPTDHQNTESINNANLEFICLMTNLIYYRQTLSKIKFQNDHTKKKKKLPS